MKTIKINESQRKRLFEAYTEGFSFDTLSVIGNGLFIDGDEYDKKYDYCEKYLGKPLNDGSGRYVFQLDDNFVLKLAMNYDGFRQNEIEVQIFEKVKSKLLARIVYADEGGSFIVSEQVLPAAPEDFEQILGMPYYCHYIQQSKQEKSRSSRHGGDVRIGFDKYFKNIVPHGTKANICVYDILCYIQGIHRNGVEQKYEDVIKNNWWFSEIKRLVTEFNVYDLYIDNFGIAYRDNKPTLVILDSGIEEEIEN
jgi:hypothetical protein